MSEWIVIWKDSPGQQVSTTVDAHNEPVRRDAEYLQAQGIQTLEDESAVLFVLKAANGDKFAITPELARATLGWDL